MISWPSENVNHVFDSIVIFRWFRMSNIYASKCRNCIHVFLKYQFFVRFWIIWVNNIKWSCTRWLHMAQKWHPFRPSPQRPRWCVTNMGSPSEAPGAGGRTTYGLMGFMRERVVEHVFGGKLQKYFFCLGVDDDAFLNRMNKNNKLVVACLPRLLNVLWYLEKTFPATEIYMATLIEILWEEVEPGMHKKCGYDSSHDSKQNHKICFLLIHSPTLVFSCWTFFPFCWV